jgi:hypothetical protein
MTNGDYIRQKMTDEYIAQEFCGIVCPFSYDCDTCPLCDNPNCESFEERLKWLKLEYVREKEEEMETETETDATSDLLSEIRNVLRMIKWYEGCDYDKYCISMGEGNIRDCIEGLQYVEKYVENKLKKTNGGGKS